eukprot:jgi/Antlo1/309/671
MNFYDIFEENVLKIEERLEAERSNIDAFLSTLLKEELVVRKLGRVSNLNVPQYLVSRADALYQRDEDPECSAQAEHYKDALVAVLKRASLSVLEHEDSKGNTLLHYCALLGNYEAMEILVVKKVKVARNFEGVLAYAICTNPHTRCLLRGYMRKYQSKYSTSRFFETVKKAKKTVDSSSSQELSFADKKPAIDFYKLNVCESAAGDAASVDDTMTGFVPLRFLKKRAKTGLGDVSGAYRFCTSNLRTKCVGDLPIEEVCIKRYPGRLYVIFDRILGLECANPGVESIFLVVRCSSWLATTSSHEASACVELREIVTVPIFRDTNEISVDICVRQSVRGGFGGILGISSVKNKRIGGFRVALNPGILGRCHNAVVKMECGIVYSTYHSTLLQMLRRMFIGSKATTSSADLFLSYIAEDELEHVEAPEPRCIDTLLDWLKVRKVSPYVWFRGFVNVRGEGGATTQLWKRRLVKWQGIHLTVHNEHSGASFGELNMTQITDFSTESGDPATLRNYVKLVLKSSVFEMIFDNSETYEKFLGSLKYFLEF